MSRTGVTPDGFSFIEPRKVDLQARRMILSFEALGSFDLVGIEAGAVQTIIAAATALTSQTDRVLEWCTNHPGQPLPKEHRTKLSDASRMVLEARAALRPKG